MGRISLARTNMLSSNPPSGAAPPLTGVWVECSLLDVMMASCVCPLREGLLASLLLGVAEPGSEGILAKETD